MPFTADERSVLLAARGVGPTVITRLEQLGYHSLAALAKADARQVVVEAASLLGSSCWRNSPQAIAAIQSAIDAASHYKVRRNSSVRNEKLPAPGATPLESAGLLNLGPKSLEFLRAAGVVSMEQLRALGAVAAYVRVKRSGASASLNHLWALEGALTDTPWQEVSRKYRTSLLLALEQHEKQLEAFRGSLHELQNQ